MTNGWSGADPTVAVDASAYSLGTAYKANVDITITHVRIWADASEINYTPRKGKIWSTGGAELASVDLPNDLPTGWSTYALAVPVERLANQQWVVSYDTGGNYGNINHALDADVPSSDGAVTALASFNAPSGINGRFNTVPGDFPATGNANHSFYGADVVYTLGVGGDTAPIIQSATITVAGVTTTATIVASDAETLTGATYRYDWGDGSPVDSTNHPTATKSHTYAVPGTYPILLSVTDAGGLTAYVARFAVIEPTPDLTGVAASDILDLVVSRVVATKQFQAVIKHEPRTAPSQFVTAAFFLGAPNAAPGGFKTIKRVSSLGTAGMLLDIIGRLYMDAKQPVAFGDRPPSLNNIDQVLLEHAEIILRECHAHISFGIQNSGIWMDADGADSEGLGALFGYLDQDNMKYRICEIYIPTVLTDYFTQESP